MKLLDYLRINNSINDFYDVRYCENVTVDYCNDEITDWYSLFCMKLYGKVQITDRDHVMWSELIINNQELFEEFSLNNWNCCYQGEEFICEWLQELHFYCAGLLDDDMYCKMCELLDNCEYKEIDLATQRYFFTFGTSEQFPYRKGYLIVYADSKQGAVDKYRKKYPDINGFINCSFVYSENEWFEAKQRLPEEFRMSSQECHEIIK